MCFCVSNRLQIGIISVIGLVPKRRQSITQTNDYPVSCGVHVSPDLCRLTLSVLNNFVSTQTCMHFLWVLHIEMAQIIEIIPARRPPPVYNNHNQNHCQYLKIRKNIHRSQGQVTLELYRSNQINELMKERRNSIANALELRLSCTNTLRCTSPVYKARLMS